MTTPASSSDRRDQRKTESDVALLDDYRDEHLATDDDDSYWAPGPRPIARWAHLTNRAPSRRFAFAATFLLLTVLVVTALCLYRASPIDPEPWVYPEVPWEPASPARKALILGSYKKQNVSWTADVPSDWEIFRYVNDDPSAKYTTPTKEGNEANAYLTFIIDHYDNLPDYMVFLHGHDRGWHQPEHSVQKIRALNLTALRHSGYLSLRCSLQPGCTAGTLLHIKNPHENPNDQRWMLDVLPGFIDWMFPDIETPEVISSPCCAQFAVSKGQVLRRSKAWWQKYRRPLVRGVKTWSKALWGAPDDGIGRYKAGIAYEKTYHLAFGKNPVFCPSEEECRSVYFSDAIHCDGYTGSFRQSKGWENITCTDTLDIDGAL